MLLNFPFIKYIFLFYKKIVVIIIKIINIKKIYFPKKYIKRINNILIMNK